MSSIVSDVRHLIYYSIMIWMKKPGKERGEASPIINILSSKLWPSFYPFYL
ncbi:MULTISPECIES: hypothetical protein [Paenibacillus]|uniref:Uncharacterized protein n=1 Tax=Paenibacillus alvei TaxID=44250 RepID=A0ABT4EDQ3_PAEAL|nr:MULTISPECIES: hypothetical protein [Paenibacillus]MCY9531879.1 hypothetical protein [Paenibacillus alvei]